MPMVAVTHKADRLRGRMDRCPEGTIQRETGETGETARPEAAFAGLAVRGSS
jgi:hypothetical protein